MEDLFQVLDVISAAAVADHGAPEVHALFLKDILLRESCAMHGRRVRGDAAQIAANETGVTELRRLVSHYGIETVHAYMRHVQDNAEESVRRVIDVLQNGAFTYPMDDGSEINVQVTIDPARRQATVDLRFLLCPLIASGGPAKEAMPN